MRRILVSLMVIAVVASSITLGAMALFTDQETSAGNTFTAKWGYLYPDAGVDETDGTYNLLSDDLDDLEESDDRRYTTQDIWDSAYSDAEYLGFTFPDIPADATVIEVLITVEWQMGPKVDAARLKVFDGLGNEQIYALTPPPKQNKDFSETIDVSAFIDTAQKVNDILVWFQAVSSKGDTTKHDLVEVWADYHR